MFTFDTKIRVRYAETDQMGYVYYGNYATYYEVARVEMLRSLGTSYKTLEDSGIMMPVLNMQSQYLKPATYDDLITVRVCMPEKPNVRIRFTYEIFSSAGELLNTGETSLVFVDMAKNKPCRAPTAFLERLAQFFD